MFLVKIQSDYEAKEDQFRAKSKCISTCFIYTQKWKADFGVTLTLLKVEIWWDYPKEILGADP